jgi:hypothetical protein
MTENVLEFVWESPGVLSEELTRPITVASAMIKNELPIDFLDLGRNDGTALRIQVEMHDVAERMELGVLVFSVVTQSSGTPNETFVPLPASMNGPITVRKLVREECETVAEAGIVLEAADGHRITVIAGAFPYSLAVDGIFDNPHEHMFDPGGSRDRYREVPL